MKTRSKAEMAAYQKARRHAMTTACNTPVTPVSVPCPDCMAKDQEIARLTAQVGALVAAQAQVDHVKGKAADTSLLEGVMAAKGGRINSYGTDHNIGKAQW